MITVDLDPKLSDRARNNLRSAGVDTVDIETADAVLFVRELAQRGKRFGFAFVDHSHAYEPVLGVCRGIGEILTPGSYVAFHDFMDKRNPNPEVPDFKVTQGVVDGLDDRFSFVGISGCIGIFRFAG